MSEDKTGNIDEILRRTVKTLYQKYCPNANAGGVSRQELHKMLFETFTVLNGGHPDNYASHFENEFSNEDFKLLFAEIDDDRSGEVSEEELVQYIKSICHL